MAKTNNESVLWEQASRGARLLLEDGSLVEGRVVWVEDYTIGFVPDFDDGMEVRMGMARGRESLIFKAS